MSTRRARNTSDDRHGLFDSDSEHESDAETELRPRRRPRQSTFQSPNSHAEADRAPLQSRSVNMNDDEAEKRRRRKSTATKMTTDATGSSSEGANRADGRTGGWSDGQVQPRNPRRLGTIVDDILATNPADREANYAQWMKMVVDNKVTTQNSWDFNLIDYFHNMDVLFDETNNSINFQRASATLEGCVKIYTSRVDSVNDPDNEAQPAKRRRIIRRDATIAKDPSQLRVKKLDLEFSVDPLFKKTCADFDEGGAHGLLMNHLSLGQADSSLRVIFDAGDMLCKVAENDGDVDDDAAEAIDLGELRSECMFLPDLNQLEDKAISHSLMDFTFANDTARQDDIPLFREDSVVDKDENFDADIGGPPQDFFDTPDDDGGVGEYTPEYTGGDMDDADNIAQNDASGPMGPFQPFDPVAASDDRELALTMSQDDDNERWAYLDNLFSKNWAGPEHHQNRRKKIFDKQAAAAPKPRAPKKKSAATAKIDFTPTGDEDLKELTKRLFRPPNNLKTLDLKPQDDEKSHQLPDDMHFSSRQLVTLFLKPKFSLKMRGHRPQYNADDGEVCGGFWAQTAAGQVAGDATNNANVPFNTQFFDEGGFDDDDGFGQGPQDEAEEDFSSQGPSRRVRPQHIQFAKKAKRVDVRKLKENIWSGLEIKVNLPKSDDSMDVDGEPPEVADPGEGRQFGTVLSGLQKSYPPEKLEEISTSFCFICLLHLANEEGLRLETTNICTVDMDDDELLVDQASNLWDVKVRQLIFWFLCEPARTFAIRSIEIWTFNRHRNVMNITLSAI
ncbi:barren [Fistulina hepatica ATCC 64428]|uniref:Condensin complex subunit 2 n=1 Tax=Fistulina hepatica ATCC 64428 TaxID=1128425 RepID=A0A0D7ANQ3_9AGAR|nr:barren [Fistulina hepatica ATCC 64428]